MKNTFRPPATIAIVPAHNEAATIGAVVHLTRNHVDQVLVVDDGSTDDTAACATAAGAVIVKLPRSEGYSSALLAGCRQALSSGGRTLVMLDADGAHSPTDIPALLDAHIRTGTELTLGNRFHPAALADIPSTKRWANFFATGLVNSVLGTKLSDVACGFRVLSWTYADALVRQGPMPGFSLAFHCLAFAQRRNVDIAAAPVAVRYNAAEFACTSRHEFADLLVACIASVTPSSVLMPPLRALQARVDTLAPVTVAINGERLCLHPVLSTAYVFQRQPEFFSQETLGDLIEFPATAPTP